MRIAAEGVTFAYGGAPVLRNVSMSAVPGELTAVVGPNGAGKSTLLSILAGLRAPDSGNVTIGGSAPADLGVAGLARRRAYLSSASPLALRYTVGEVVEMGAFPWSRGRGPAVSEAAQHAMAKLELGALADKKLSRLSSGEARRAQIARALAQETDALVLDEPVGGLDLRSAEMVMLALRERAEAGAAVVMVAHDLNSAARHADSVVLLASGEAVQGAPELVLTETELSRAYATTIRVGRVGGEIVVLPGKLA